MKKIFAIFLVAALAATLVACGTEKATKDHQAEQELFETINSAYMIVDALGSDVYCAWRVGLQYETDGGFTMEKFAKEVSLPIDDLRYGFVTWLYMVQGTDWNSISKAKQEQMLFSADEMFESLCDYYPEKIFSNSVDIVVKTYDNTGKLSEAENYLNVAKAKLRVLEQTEKDTELYHTLKKYLTATVSYFEDFKDPSGSFEMLKDSISKYRDEVRQCKSELSLVL